MMMNEADKSEAQGVSASRRGITDQDLAPNQRVLGNMWQHYYQVAHRELVVANRAVQRLSQRCRSLRFTLHNLTITLGRNERERFEHWAEYWGLDLEKDSRHRYVYANTALAWEAWQARARLDAHTDQPSVTPK